MISYKALLYKIRQYEIRRVGTPVHWGSYALFCCSYENSATSPESFVASFCSCIRPKPNVSHLFSISIFGTPIALFRAFANPLASFTGKEANLEYALTIYSGHIRRTNRSFAFGSAC